MKSTIRLQKMQNVEDKDVIVIIFEFFFSFTIFIIES